MNINKVIFGGRLAADPEVREVGSSQVANFRLINNRVYFKGRGDEREKCEEVTAMDVKVWGGRANFAKHVGKGDSLVVEGFLKEESWEKDGQKQYKKLIEAQEIHFGEKKGSRKAEDKKEEKKEDPPKEPENDDTPPDEVPF